MLINNNYYNVNTEMAFIHLHLDMTLKCASNPLKNALKKAVYLLSPSDEGRKQAPEEGNRPYYSGSILFFGLLKGCFVERLHCDGCSSTEDVYWPAAIYLDERR